MLAYHRHRSGPVWILFTVVALLLAACGSDSSDSAGPDSEGSGGEQSTATEVTLRVAAPAVLSSLDSERYQGFVSVDVLLTSDATNRRRKPLP